MRRLRLQPLLRLLRRQDGISLVMSVGVLGVLSMSGTTVVYYSSGNARSAEFSSARDLAYDTAEAGVSQALSVLATASSPVNGSILPPTTVTVEGNEVTYSGTLSGTKWTITATGKVDNPADPASAHATRTISREVHVHSRVVGSLDRGWDRIAITAPAVCTEVKTITIPGTFASNGNLCLKGTAKLTGAVSVNGNVTLESNSSIGNPGPPIVRAPSVAVSGTCKLAANAAHQPCGDADRVYADSVSTAPGDLAKPTVDFAYWYENAKPGPRNPCTTQTGSPPAFDDNGTYAGAMQAAKEVTPAGSSYTCQVKDANNAVVGELSWNHVSHVLTVKGTIFFDGKLDFRDDDQLVNYQGRGAIYASGEWHSDEAICAGGNGTTDCRTAGMSSWDPSQNLLVIVAGAKEAAGNVDIHFHKTGAFQGVLYAVHNCKIDNTPHASGPIICNDLDIPGGWPTFYSWPALPGPAAGQLYNATAPKNDFQLVLGSQSG